jgi:hypothetical protein
LTEPETGAAEAGGGPSGITAGIRGAIMSVGQGKVEEFPGMVVIRFA